MARPWSQIVKSSLCDFHLVNASALQAATSYCSTALQQRATATPLRRATAWGGRAHGQDARKGQQACNSLPERGHTGGSPAISPLVRNERLNAEGGNEALTFEDVSRHCAS